MDKNVAVFVIVKTKNLVLYFKGFFITTYMFTKIMHLQNVYNCELKTINLIEKIVWKCIHFLHLPGLKYE